MRAAVVTATPTGKQLVVRELADPVAGPTDVLVRVSRAGVCGSDTHGFLDPTGTARRDGLVMGHEIGGVVEAVGDQAPGLRPGQRVHVDPQVVCHACPPCRAGWISICDGKRVLGSSLRGFQQGGMAELVVADHRAVHPLPDEVGDDLAPLIEPLANAVHAVRRVSVPVGGTALVIGGGPLGLCMVEVLVSDGVQTVLVSETSEHKRAIAAALGAVVVDPAEEDLDARVREVAGAEGVDVTIEAVGVSATYRQAVEVTRKRGRIGFFGAVASEVTLPLLPILHKELTLVGCTGANDETAEAIALVASGAVRLAGWSTRTVGLGEAEAAIRELADPHGSLVKVLVDPSR